MANRLFCGDERCLHNALGKCLAHSVTINSKKHGAYCNTFVRDQSEYLAAAVTQAFIGPGGSEFAAELCVEPFPRVVCAQSNCLHNEGSRCKAAKITISKPEKEGRHCRCATYRARA